MDGSIKKPQNKRKKKAKTQEEKKKQIKIVELVKNDRPKRTGLGLSTSQMDESQRNLAVAWNGLILAGIQDDEVDIETEGERSCGAIATMNDDETVDGEFKSEDCHAEMDVLQNVVKSGYTLDDIVLIEIEKQPCPRCAVVLNKLHLNHLVRYKNTGQRDYPTWRYPKIGGGHNWAVTMGISAYVNKLTQQDELLTYFRTNKWWH